MAAGRRAKVDGATKLEGDGQLKDGVARFDNERRAFEIKDGVLCVLAPNDDVLAELKKVERQSPTLDEKPPEGAIVLFDGSSADAFDPGKLTPNEPASKHFLAAGTTSKRKFQNCQLHLEFQLPFMPDAEGQAPGNSGCYLQGRYEVQMLDSFGLDGKDNECGGLYSIRARGQHVLSAALMADLRHRLHGRQIRRRTESEGRDDQRQAQRRADPHERSVAQGNDRRTVG